MANTNFPFLRETYLGKKLISKEAYSEVNFNIDVNDSVFEFKEPDEQPKRLTESRHNSIVWVNHSSDILSFQQLIETFKGQAILIGLWATWCAPCRYEFTKYSESYYDFLDNSTLSNIGF